MFVELPELLLDFLEFFVREIFDVDHAGPGPFNAAQKLVEFQMNRFGVAVLGVLDEKDHQKSHDGRSGVDNQLPGIGKVKNRPGGEPDENNSYGQNKGPGRAGSRRDS